MIGRASCRERVYFEESGQALALLLVVSRPRYRWILNGLLLGAAVGTGFAVFESAGYALDIGLSQSVAAMKENILTRGFLSVLGGHTLWTGLVGAALWRVRGAAPFEVRMFFDARFLRVFAIAAALHMLWNSPVQLPMSLKYILLGAPAWLLILSFIHLGLKEVKAAQIAEATGERQTRLASEPAA